MTLNGNLTRVVEDSSMRYTGALDANSLPVTEVVKVKLVVAEADVLIASRRYRLQREALKFYGQEDSATFNPPKGVDEDEYNLRVLTYPNLVAATLSAEGIPWPLPFEAFLHLRQVLWDKWSDAVVALNPQWYGARAVSTDPKAPSAQPTATSNVLANL